MGTERLTTPLHLNIASPTSRSPTLRHPRPPHHPPTLCDGCPCLRLAGPAEVDRGHVHAALDQEVGSEAGDLLLQAARRLSGWKGSDKRKNRSQRGLVQRDGRGLGPGELQLSPQTLGAC